MIWKANFKPGAANNAAPTPKADAAARMPVPTGTPNKCGKVARNPNRAPEAVSITTLGPGENSPAKTNANSGAEAARRSVNYLIRASVAASNT